MTTNKGKWAVIGHADKLVAAGYFDTYDQASMARDMVGSSRTHTVTQLGEYSRYREAARMLRFEHVEEITVSREEFEEVCYG
jgi:hypothetical protein